MMSSHDDLTSDNDDLAVLIDLLGKYGHAPDSMPEEFEARLERIVDVDEFVNQCRSDLPRMQAAYLLLHYRDARKPLAASELLELIDRIRHPIYAGEFGEADSLLDIIRFDANCIDPRKDDLIFATELSDEEIVASALGRTSQS